MVETLEYQALGQWQEVSLLPLYTADSSRARGRMGGRRAVAYIAAPPANQPNAEADAMIELINDSPVLRTRVSDPSKLMVVQGKVPVRRSAAGGRKPSPAPISTYDAVTFATETVIAEGLLRDDFEAAKKFGAWIIEEGTDGGVLFAVDSVERAFDLAQLLVRREVGLATPNFIRRYVKVRSSAESAEAWSHAMIDVSGAWAITKGHKDVKVAVLDEGVDTSHPALKPAVVAERDFAGDNDDSAMPRGNDAHGTACAGIVLSRNAQFPGIAPECSLIAARIGIGDDHSDNWVVYDDRKSAEAIKWSFREGAAVLSNSWGGGAPSNAIARAFARANTEGRGGLGAVVVIAAGNDEMPIDFPGNLPGYVTVGASNADDERKTYSSSDGEPWGSNYGATLTLLAPGVSIWTTDIAGLAGYDPGDFTRTFNGTSAATPAVAATAALMISANPALSAASVRDLLGSTAHMLKGQKAWTQELGWGRLDVAKAVAAAKAAGTGLPPKAP